MARRKPLDLQTRLMCVLAQHFFLRLNAPDLSWSIRAASKKFDELRRLVPTLGQPITHLDELPPKHFIDAAERYVLPSDKLIHGRSASDRFSGN